MKNSVSPFRPLFSLFAALCVSDVAYSDGLSAKAPDGKPVVTCEEGVYPRHLQGVATDGAFIYWSFTDKLTKTDAEGRNVKTTGAPNHSGDLCCVGGVLYVATNLGKFNTEDKADSWVYAYKAGDLSFVSKWKVPELRHGAGGITWRDGRFYVVGGLPKDHVRNYVYEYTPDFKFVTRHVLETGYTGLGIQTAAYENGKFYFGCYRGTDTNGTPVAACTLECPPSLDSFRRLTPSTEVGLISLGGRLLRACTKSVPVTAGHASGFVGRLLRACTKGVKGNWSGWLVPFDPVAAGEASDYPPPHADMSNPDEARTFYIDTMERLADFALVPPRLNQDPLPEYAYTNLDYAMNGTVALTPGGRLWAGWLSGGDDPNGFFVSNRSDDGGETWSDPLLVVDGHDARLPVPRFTLCADYWCDPDGKLHVFHDQTTGGYAIPGARGCTTSDSRRGVWESVCADPDAPRPHWSKPRRISDGNCLNKPIVLANGDWLLPVARGIHAGPPFADAFRDTCERVKGAWWLGSSDKGITWKMRGGCRFPDSTWFEHMAYQMRDGRLRMFARTRKGIMESYSSDNGHTWTAPAFPDGIRHPLSRFFVRRLASGNVLFVKHGLKIDDDNKGGRDHLTAWLSRDDGKTWEGGLVLEPATCSYPDGVEGPGGTVYVTYDHERDRAAEIRMARFTEEDVLAGKIVSPRGKLGILVFKGQKRTRP